VEKVQRGQIDYFLLVIIILLFGVGLSVLFSASYFHAEKLGKNPQYFFNKQIIWLVLGGLFAYLVSRAPLELIRKSIPYVLISAFLILLLPFVPGLGKDINGARRWIFFFDYSFQPSEYVKLALILYLASILQKKEKKLDDPLHSLLPPLIIVSLFVVVIFLQNDLSTAAFIFFMAVSLFYIAKIRLVYFFYMATIVLPIGIVILFTKTYWVEKLMVFLDPGRNPESTGYQIITSRISLATGGLCRRNICRRPAPTLSLPWPVRNWGLSVCSLSSCCSPCSPCAGSRPRLKAGTVFHFFWHSVLPRAYWCRHCSTCSWWPDSSPPPASPCRFFPMAARPSSSPL
jgi:cell division protein FtsW